VGGPIGPVPVLGAWVGGAVDDGEVGADGVDAAELRPDVVLVVSVASAGGEDAPGLLLPCPGAAAVVGGASVFEWRAVGGLAGFWLSGEGGGCAGGAAVADGVGACGGGAAVSVCGGVPASARLSHPVTSNRGVGTFGNGLFGQSTSVP